MPCTYSSCRPRAFDFPLSVYFCILSCWKTLQDDAFVFPLTIRCAAARRNRKKFVAIAKRCERVCKRTAERSVTFCGKGGAAACACSDFQKEIGASDIKLAPMWRARHDSNVRPTESESVALSNWATSAYEIFEGYFAFAWRRSRYRALRRCSKSSARSSGEAER